MMALLLKAEAWNIDVDRYVNRIIPPSPLHQLPTPVSRFLGYRKEPQQDVGNVLGAFWSLLGTLCGLAVVAAVFNNTKVIQMHHPPALIASYVSTLYHMYIQAWPVKSRDTTTGRLPATLFATPYIRIGDVY